MAQGESENRQSGVDSSAAIASAVSMSIAEENLFRQGQKTLQFCKDYSDEKR